MKTFKEFLFGKNIDIISEEYNIKELKCLSPDGKEECPQGVYLAKGKWYQQVRINESNFSCAENFTPFGEAVADQQYNLPKYKGGVIVFSTDVNAVSDKGIKSFFKNKIKTIVNRVRKNKKLSKLIDKHNKENIEDYFIGAFSIGKFFNGRYVGDNGKIYDEKSSSIEINGVPSEVLLLLGTEIAKEFDQETVLIKDLNKNKFYLANQKDVEDVNKEMQKL